MSVTDYYLGVRMADDDDDDSLHARTRKSRTTVVHMGVVICTTPTCFSDVHVESGWVQPQEGGEILRRFREVLGKLSQAGNVTMRVPAMTAQERTCQHRVEITCVALYALCLPKHPC
jgi:hypothetical protein